MDSILLILNNWKLKTKSEKIEERNEDLHKLRKKTTPYKCWHILKKSQFEQAQNEPQVSIGNFRWRADSREGPACKS